MRKHFLLTHVITAVLLAACGPSDEEVAIAVAGYLEETHAVETMVAGTAEVLQLTEHVRATESAVTATQQYHANVTETAASEATAAAIAAETATVEAAYSLATAEASSMQQQVLDLASEGWLSRTEGAYHPLPDFNQTWAQIYWYRWWYTEYSPADFVLRAHARMDDATSYKDRASGCGVVFREQGEENYYRFSVNMYGGAVFSRVYKGSGKGLGGGSFGAFNARKEEVDFILIVDGGTFHALINGEHVVAASDDVLREGNFGLSLTSGTNRDYGTRCHMTDIELWILE